ncbi:MAG TPA: MOSC domain-containing protein [Caldithrix abyssi]|uniref:MOSC domain-containing protein n=1 Tax=Caldithrix abyssi TaxID=187145 RepID=A0A7V1PU27_CALAY|nr:MOSC domain-containing protein [Caldithrix abyssi]
MVKAIWIKTARRGAMKASSRVRCITDAGLEGNANQGGKRQITIIEEENWQAMMDELGADLAPWQRRANVMVSGFPLKESKGRVLQLGEISIRIEGETRPCERMDEALPGLREAMKPEWRGGVYGRILNDGTIKVGDTVRWREE